jgi:hypothetical protein
VTNEQLFDDPTEVKPVHQIDPSKDYLSELVGEGKKYADAAALARSRLEADNHIARIERENAGIRAELQKRLSMEELLTKLQSQTQAPAAGQDNQKTNSDGSQNQPQTAEVKPEEVSKLVQSELAKARAADIARTNLQFAKQKLTEAFGENYREVLDAKVKELGVTQDYLNRLAMEQPNVLLKLVGEPPKAQNAQVPTGRTIDASKQVLNNQTPADGFKGQKYFTSLLKSDPAKFWSAKTQLEMHEMAMRDPQRYASS